MPLRIKSFHYILNNKKNDSVCHSNAGAVFFALRKRYYYVAAIVLLHILKMVHVFFESTFVLVFAENNRIHIIGLPG